MFVYIAGCILVFLFKGLVKVEVGFEAVFKGDLGKSEISTLYHGMCPLEPLALKELIDPDMEQIPEALFSVGKGSSNCCRM